MKKFKLLKDTPDAEANTPLFDAGDGTYQYISNLGETSWYKKEYVEYNSNWFELIPEQSMPKQEERIDHDLLGTTICYLKAFIDLNKSGLKADETSKDAQKIIEYYENNFKKPNSTTEVDKILDIDEAKHVEYWHNEFKVASKSLGEWIEKYCKLEKENDAMMKNVWEAAREHHLHNELKDGIEVPVIKWHFSSLERFLNLNTNDTGNEFEQARCNPIERDGNFKNSAPKDWEIIKCMGATGKLHYYEPNLCLGKDSTVLPCTIHSVKRKDGVVFSVGDMLTDLGFDNHSDKINSIYEINGTIALGYGNGGAVIINYAKKLPTPTEQTKSDILFTTEQYKEIWDMIFSQTGFPPNHPKTKRNK